MCCCLWFIVYMLLCWKSRPVAEDAEEGYTLFWRFQSPFSQHHPANFVIDGISYNCAEQYMMHQKAGNSCSSWLLFCSLVYSSWIVSIHSLMFTDQYSYDDIDRQQSATGDSWALLSAVSSTTTNCWPGEDSVTVLGAIPVTTWSTFSPSSSWSPTDRIQQEWFPSPVATSNQEDDFLATV